MVRPADVAAAQEVLFRITAELTPKAGKGELLMAAKGLGKGTGDTSSVDDQGVALQEGHSRSEELRAAKPGDIIISIGEDYSDENGSKGLHIQCAIMNSFYCAKNGNSDDTRDINLGETKGPLATSVTHPAFQNRPGTAHDFHIDEPAKDEYSDGRSWKSCASSASS